MDGKEQLTKNYNLVWGVIKIAILLIAIYSLFSANFTLSILFPLIVLSMLPFGFLSWFAYELGRKETYPSGLRMVLLIISSSLLLAGCSLMAKKGLDINGILGLGGILIGWGLCLCVEWEIKGGY